VAAYAFELLQNEGTKALVRADIDR